LHYMNGFKEGGKIHSNHPYDLLPLYERREEKSTPITHSANNDLLPLHIL
jgi:hypothetical protein